MRRIRNSSTARSFAISFDFGFIFPQCQLEAVAFTSSGDSITLVDRGPCFVYSDILVTICTYFVLPPFGTGACHPRTETADDIVSAITILVWVTCLTAEVTFKFFSHFVEFNLIA